MRGAAVLGFGALLLAAGASPSSAQSPKLLAPTSEPVVAVSGAWEISAGGGERQCRIQLSARETKDRRMVLGALPVCKASIPALAQAAQWALGEDGAIYLYKLDGAPLYLFRRGAAGVFKAEGGVDLALEPVGGRANEESRPESVAATLNALTGQAPAKDADRAALTGAYALGRARGGDVCTLELGRAPGPRPKSGGAVWAASLDQACGDDGLRTFDPVGWQFDNGRIVLLAKRGVTIGFTRNGDAWRKDPESGRPLWMTRR